MFLKSLAIFLSFLINQNLENVAADFSGRSVFLVTPFDVYNQKNGL
jgi:hypothetical protein